MYKCMYTHVYVNVCICICKCMYMYVYVCILYQPKIFTGIVPTLTGKNKITFTGYLFLAKLAVITSKCADICMFAWVYLLLCWNLMARANNVATISYTHFAWAGDALTVTFLRYMI